MSTTSSHVDRLHQQIADLTRELETLRTQQAAYLGGEQRPADGAWFQSLAEGSPDVILLLDCDATIRFVNRPMAGRVVSELAGTKIFDHVDKRYHQRMRACFHDVINDRETGSYEVAYRDFTGEQRIYESRVGPIIRKGRVEGLAVTSRDVTAQIAASRALRASQRENEALLQAIPDMLLRVSRDGTYLAFKQANGFRPWKEDANPIGKNVRDSVPPTIARQALMLIQQAIDTGTTRSMVASLPTGGGVLYRDVRIVPAGNSEALIMIRDVTQRRRAEQQRDDFYRIIDAIRRVQEQYITRPSVSDFYQLMLRELSALTDSGFALIGDCQPPESSNSSWRMVSAFDATREEQYATSPAFHCQNQSFNAALDRLVQTLENTRAAAVVDKHNEVALKENSRIAGNSTAQSDTLLGVPVLDNGKLINFIALANRPGGYDQALVEHLQPFLASCATMLLAHRHQRQRQEAEQRLREQQSQLAHVTRLTTLGEMVATIAHEITQPLSAINIYAAALATHFETGAADLPAGLKDTHTKISKQAARAGRIIERLRHFARRAEPQLSEFALDAVIADAIELIQLSLQQRKTTVSLHIEGEPYPVIADRLQIQQVIVNLLNNACEAMNSLAESRREVRLALTYEPMQTMISVSDDGPGLDEQIRPRIFEAFYTTKADGIGMGLAICRSIVDFHGGRIWNTPNGNGGTTFHFILPKDPTLIL